MLLAIDRSTYEVLAEAETASQLHRLIAEEFGADLPGYMVLPGAKMVERVKRAREGDWK